MVKTVRDLPSMRRVILNTGWNLGGQGFTFVLQILLLPFLVHGLGENGYGVWALSSAVAGCLYPLDLGLRRALVFYLAKSRTCPDDRKGLQFFESAMALIFISGSVGFLLIILILPSFLNRWMAIPQTWLTLARVVILYRALALIGELITGVMKSVPTAAQDLARTNILQSLFTTLLWVGMATIAILSHNPQKIALYFAIIHFASITAFYFLAKSYWPTVWPFPRINRPCARKLFRFGQWLTLSQIIEPVLLQSEKFFIPRYVDLASLGYYSVPYQLATKIWQIITAFINAYFPALSDHVSRLPRENHGKFVYQGVWLIFIITLWPISFLILFAQPLLAIWMGSNFALHGAFVLQVLAAGVFINVINWPILAYLQVSGAPELPTSFHLLEAILYIPLSLFLVSNLGIQGAALAWSTRMLMDTLFLYSAFYRKIGIKNFIPDRRQSFFLLIIGLALSIGFLVRYSISSTEVLLLVGALTWIFLAALTIPSELRMIWRQSR